MIQKHPALRFDYFIRVGTIVHLRLAVRVLIAVSVSLQTRTGAEICRRVDALLKTKQQAEGAAPSDSLHC